MCRLLQMSQFLPVLSSLRRLEAQLNGVEEVLEDLISNPVDLESIAALRHTHAGVDRRDDEDAQEGRLQRTATQVAVQDVEFLLESCKIVMLFSICVLSVSLTQTASLLQ